MTQLVIHAPFRGWVRALDDVPDPAFAQRMVGEGLAVDPLECELVAPCAGTVVAVAPTGHSVTLRTDDGIDLLLHIGIDTVKLAGSGFEAAVQPGTEVRTGDLLIAFDPDVIARSAPSLVTPVVVTSPETVIALIASPGPIERGAPLFSVALAGTPPPPAEPGSDNRVSRKVCLTWSNGIHARPAAQIVRTARQYDCTVRIEAGGKSAVATSLSELLALGVGPGSEIGLVAGGVEATAALAALEQLFAADLHDEHPDPASDAAPEPTRFSPTQLGGVKAAPGLGIGPVFRIDHSDLTLDPAASAPAAETAALDQAIAAVTSDIEHRAAGQGDAACEIALAHCDMLLDDELRSAAQRAIDTGSSAAAAWRSACRSQEAVLTAGGNARLAARAADYRDIERQVLQVLSGSAPERALALPDGKSVIVADELLPSEFLALDPARIAAICTARGGATSHVAILAAARGLPMLVALGDGIAGLTDGQMVIVEADAGTLETRPTAAQLAETAARLEGQITAARANALAAAPDCVMADGTRIEVFANLASLADVRQAVAAGAEGCGLLRTEFLFMERDTAPDEQSQADAYANIAAALEGRPLIVRTLDIGGDKPVPYLPFPPEDNPALGARGIRHSLANPDLFGTQLRAILRGVPAAQCRIMLPMVIELDELRAVRKLTDRIAADLGLTQRVPLGVMIETPAAAMLAESLAAEADFLSVGSNDLAQYALAIDRGNPQLAARADACHPAVLRLIAEGARGAARHGRWFGICGGLASDPDAAALLVGLGVNELSATPTAIPAIKARLRGLSRAECISLAERALAVSSAGEVRALVREGP